LTGATLINQNGVNYWTSQINTGSPVGRNCSQWTFIIKPTALQTIFASFTNTIVYTGVAKVRVIVAPINIASVTSTLANAAHVVPGNSDSETVVVPRPPIIASRQIFLDKIRAPAFEHKHDRKFSMIRQGHTSIPIKLKVLPDEEYYDEKLVRVARENEEKDVKSVDSPEHSHDDEKDFVKRVSIAVPQAPLDSREGLRERISGQLAEMQDAKESLDHDSDYDSASDPVIVRSMPVNVDGLASDVRKIGEYAHELGKVSWTTEEVRQLMEDVRLEKLQHPERFAPRGYVLPK